MNINIIAKAKLPTIWAEFSILVFSEISNGKEHLVLSLGELERIPLLRIHSQCLTGDALFSLRCDCGSQLQMSLKMIADKGNGLLIYMAQEGRGIGLGNKIRAYALQDQGLNTIEANEKLGFEADQRDYSICGEILSSLDIDKVKLITNNPDKVKGLEESGIGVEERISLTVAPTKHNKEYLNVKEDSMGHLFNK
ncbi:MAG: GTP cyclohydrolase II [Gammaproteobacteria bacterium]|nr:GTP cyclohydrolase II [Gammaproteobacteria bacterium]